MLRRSLRVLTAALRDGGAGRMGLVLLLAAALLGTSTLPAFAQTPQATDPALVKSEVQHWGVGKCVKMTLVSGEQVTGHIRTVGVDSFTIKSHKTDRTIPYAQVTQIKDPGPLGWLLIGAAIVIVTILIVRH